MPSVDAKDFRSLFQEIDVDGSGKVDRAEFSGHLCRIAEEMTPEEANVIFDCIDQDGNQEISFLEFVASMVDSRSVNINEINQAFKLLDQEGKGYISHKDIYRLLATKGGLPSAMSPKGEGHRKRTGGQRKKSEDDSGESALSTFRSTASIISWASFLLKPGRETLDSAPQGRRKSNAGESAVSQEGALSIPPVETKGMEVARLDKLQQKVREIINEADQDGDGKISYAEFLVAMTCKNANRSRSNTSGSFHSALTNSVTSPPTEAVVPQLPLQQILTELSDKNFCSNV